MRATVKPDHEQLFGSRYTGVINSIFTAASCARYPDLNTAHRMRSSTKVKNSRTRELWNGRRLQADGAKSSYLRLIRPSSGSFPTAPITFRACAEADSPEGKRMTNKYAAD